MRLHLTDLAVGDEARVLGFESGSDYTTALQRLGLTPGTTFRVQRRAPLGNPIEIRFRGYSLALRPEEAVLLELERL